MSSTITVTLPTATRDLVVEALHAESTRRQRAATRAAAELDAEAEGGRRDVRSSAVQIARALAAAAHLDDVARAIAAAPVDELTLGELDRVTEPVEAVAEKPAKRRKPRTDPELVAGMVANAVAASADLVANPGITADEVAPRGATPDRVEVADAIAATGGVLRALNMTIDPREVPDDLDELDVELDPLQPDDEVAELPQEAHAP